MSALLEQIRIWTEEVIHLGGYPGIALMMLVENIFPPIPSEVVMPLSGFLVIDGRFHFLGVVIAGTVGALIGALVLYYSGKKAGEERVRGWFRRHGSYLLLSEKDFDRVMRGFETHGTLLVLIGRVIPGVRSLISIPAGVYGMNLPVFLFYTTVGTFIWNIFLTGSGVVLGSRWEEILHMLEAYETILWIVVGVSVAYFIVRRFMARSS